MIIIARLSTVVKAVRHLVIASATLLTLLLAPDAYIAIGLAFAALLLVALGLMAASRRPGVGAPGPLASPTR